MNDIQLFPLASSATEMAAPATNHGAAPNTPPPVLDPPAALLARQAPRDEDRARLRALRACRQPDLAEAALAQAPDGSVHPTLALAEALARHWGNLESGVMELGATADGTLLMVYAWDLEANTRHARRFLLPGPDAAPGAAKPSRWRAPGAGLPPASPPPARLPALAAALRECLLGVLPRPLVAAAMAECDRTLRSPAMGPAAPRAQSLAAGFAELGLAPATLTPAPGETVFPASAAELNRLSRILNTLREGLAQPADFFLATAPAEPPAAPRTAPPLPHPRLASKPLRRAKKGVNSGNPAALVPPAAGVNGGENVKGSEGAQGIDGAKAAGSAQEIENAKRENAAVGAYETMGIANALGSNENTGANGVKEASSVPTVASPQAIPATQTTQASQTSQTSQVTQATTQPENPQ